MSESIIVAIISLVGSLMGTLTSVIISTKLTNYRIEQLEKKVDKFTIIEERLNKLELHNAVQDEKAEALSDKFNLMQTR